MTPEIVPVRMPGRRAAAVVAALRGGPRYEGDRECGLTHFMEHMLFRGAARHREPRALMAAFEAVGDEPFAHTGDDEIVLGALVSPDRVADAARLIASVLLRPAWRDLERERRIILEERLAYVDERGEPIDVDDVSRRLVFAGHPLGRSLIGEEEDVRRVRRADLERHRRRIVTAGNLAVAVAGPIEERDVAAVRAAFAAVPDGPALESVPVVLPDAPRSAVVRVPGATQCDVRFTFAGPGADDPRAPALHLLAAVLDGGPTARLPLRLVDAGYVYEASAGLAAFEDVSLLEVDLAVSTPRFVETFERALRLVLALRDGVERAEVERARERLLRGRAFARDSVRDAAEWHARRALFGRPAEAAEVAALERVRPRDVLAAAREVLRPERFASVLVGDLPPPARRGAEAVLRRFTGRRFTGARVPTRVTSGRGPRRA